MAIAKRSRRSSLFKLQNAVAALLAAVLVLRGLEAFFTYGRYLLLWFGSAKYGLCRAHAFHICANLDCANVVYHYGCQRMAVYEYATIFRRAVIFKVGVGQRA